MSASKKHMLESERAFLLALGQELCPFFAGLTWREACACGVSGKQYYEIKRGEPVNFTALTVRRLEVAMGLSAGELLALAERNAPRFAYR